MAGNRDAAIDLAVKTLEAILPGNPDGPRLKTYLESLNDKALDAFMEDLRSGKKFISLTAPNFGKSNLSLERNFAVGDKLGVKFYQRLWVEGDNETPSHLTPIEYLVVKLPVRIASQRIQKKMSIPKTQRVINTLTGQPTGESKGAGISFPELRVCAAMGLQKSMVELLKYRGGDQRGGAALNASLMRTGHASLKTLEHFASGVVSTATVKTFLTAAMLKNTL